MSNNSDSSRVRSHAIAIDADGWLDVLWPGEFDDPRGPERVTEADMEEALARFHARAAAEGESFAGIAIWVGHPEDEGTAASAPARAWCTQMRRNTHSGRIQVRPHWVGDAYEELIASKAYRFISNREAGRIDADGYWHPVEILSIGLTNVPARKKGQRVLSHAAAPQPQNPGMETDTMGSEDTKGLALLTRSHGLTGDALSLVEEIVGDADTAEAAANALITNMVGLSTALVQEKARSHALADELEAAIVDTLVFRGEIEDAADGAKHVRALVAADPIAARSHFLRDGAVVGAAGAAELAGRLRPEKGLRLTGDIDASGVDAIRGHAAKLVREGEDYARAHAIATELHRAGKLPAAK